MDTNIEVQSHQRYGSFTKENSKDVHFTSKHWRSCQHIQHIWWVGPRKSVCSTITLEASAKKKSKTAMKITVIRPEQYCFRDLFRRSSTIPLQCPMPWKLFGLGDAPACLCVYVPKCGRDNFWEAKGRKPGHILDYQASPILWHTEINLSTAPMLWVLPPLFSFDIAAAPMSLGGGRWCQVWFDTLIYSELIQRLTRE